MNKKGSILVVDDNRNVLISVKMLLKDVFSEVVTTPHPSSIPARLREQKPDVVLLDMNFGSGVNCGNEGLYWLRHIRQARPETQVVLFTAYADIALAVEGIKQGAADFIVKPFDNGKLMAALTGALNSSPTARTASGNRMFWGTGEKMAALRTMVEKVAATDANILITGENGTGKEVLASEIHRLSLRASRQMLTIDMGAVSETLFESELFGHVKGAFTDAKADKPGKFEQAEGGTLFLDEIGNLSYSLQAKLLSALQSRTIVRVGGSQPIDIDVRLISATNRDLRMMMGQGTFREDLLYRINTIHLHLPPLRERTEDILPLARLFLGKYAGMYNRSGIEFSSEAERKMTAMPWKGNVRELQHVVEKAVILCDSHTIAPDDIEAPLTMGGTGTGGVHVSGDQHTLDEMERSMIAGAVDECGGNLSKVATRLGISRQTLYNKIKKYGL